MVIVKELIGAPCAFLTYHENLELTHLRKPLNVNECI